MSYPGLGIDHAKDADLSRRNGDDSPDVGGFVVRKQGDDFDEATAIDCLNRCAELVVMAKDEDWSRSAFDGRCAPIVHATLRLSPWIAGDADFWCWLTFAESGFGAEIVDWRYGRPSEGDPSPARPVYYGLESMKKGMFAKLWMCANAMHVASAENPYDGIEYADVDLWDSHIIDVDYGSVPAMARAFVRLVRDEELPRGEPNRPGARAGFRDLAKEIRRRNATIAFELFDDDGAYRWLERLWEERKSWCGKR